ncbi:class E sortase [Candidatus Daviesbacteria bacterium]|nr:class E sortase [Candidatus Daviesbacteria bacterium]
MIAYGKSLSLVLLFLGVFAISQVVFPWVSFKLWEFRGQYEGNTYLTSPQLTKNQEILGVSIKNKANFSQIVSSATRVKPASYTRFSLIIPSIKLDNETVYVDTNDLSHGLVHLPGSALPGEKGNVFVSGHSALPSYIGPKAKALFANLPKVKKGEKIIIETEGVIYNYLVDSIKVIDPKDLSVITPPDTQGRFITLMTCVPPGFNTKRLIVVGKMI